MDNQPSPTVNMSNMAGHTPPPVKRGGASLMIAIIVSLLFLLAAIGIGVWLVWQKNSTVPVEPTDTTVTKDVKKVTWVAPETLPALYVKRDQNTRDAATTYYYDDATICGITTTVTNISATKGASAKEAVTNMAKDGQMQGVTLISSFDGAEYTISDATDKQQYPFPSLDIVQNVNVEGIAFKKQETTVAYKQFGDHLATIAFTCQDATWNTKKAELAKLLKTFTVKVER